jgi:hypothetical protein
MDNENISSGQDYAQLLINNLIEGELEVPEEERMDSRFLLYWCEEISTFADQTWQDYILGNRESYKFQEEEIRKLFEKAGLRYASDLLDGLVDKEMVQVGVRQDGELVYSLTEKGKDITV